MSTVFDRLRLVGRGNDFLNQYTGSNGDLFYNKDTNALRIYNGSLPGGTKIITDAVLRQEIADSSVATITYNVTVGNLNDSQNRFILNTKSNPQLTFIKGFTYIFDQSHTSNLDEILLLSADDPNGTLNNGSVFSTDVLYMLNNIAVDLETYLDRFEISTSKQLRISITSNTPDILYYFSKETFDFGNMIQIQFVEKIFDVVQTTGNIVPILPDPNNPTDTNLGLPEERWTNIYGNNLFVGDILPLETIVYNIGSSDKRWNEIYSNNLQINNGNITITTGNFVIDNGNFNIDTGSVGLLAGDMSILDGNMIITTGDLAITTGNVAITTGDLDVGTGNLNINNGQIYISANIIPIENNTSILGASDKYLNVIYTNDIEVLGNITPLDDQTPGDLGALNNPFNDIYASFFRGTAIQAQYADLAENYISDKKYTVGTVVIFGGEKEVTISKKKNDKRVAGIISSKPALLMNKNLKEKHTLPIAFQGKVLCKVIGKVKKGDILVTSNTKGYAIVNNNPKPGTILGKSLQNKKNKDKGKIFVVVGRD